MSHYGAREIARSFRTVRENTLTIAREIPEEKYDFRATPDTKSVSQLLTHIAISNGFQHQIHVVERLSTLEGFDFPSLFSRLQAEEAKQRGKDQILELLESRGRDWASWLEGLSDEFLAQPVGMPPGVEPTVKSRFEMIISVKEHEMHHRGQLMLMQRMLGLVPHLTRRMQEMMAQARKG